MPALSDTVRLLQREPRAGPHQQERRLHRLHRRLQRLGDGAECSREHAQAADETATKGRELGAGEWHGFQSRQEGFHPLRSAAATRSWANELFGVRQQDDGVAEANQAAKTVIDNDSGLTAASTERLRELSGVLRLVKAERAKGLHTNEDDICVKHYT